MGVRVVRPLEQVRTRGHATERLFQLAAAFERIEEVGVIYSTER